MPAMKIKIDRTHIAKAIKGDAQHCMIAEAIREKHPEARWVMVDAQLIRWTNRKEGIRVKYLTPRPAQQALLRFDLGESIPPFSISLASPIVEPIHPSTRRGPNKASKENPKSKKKVSTRQYKHKKVVPEATAIRTYGLRTRAA